MARKSKLSEECFPKVKRLFDVGFGFETIGRLLGLDSTEVFYMLKQKNMRRGHAQAKQLRSRLQGQLYVHIKDMTSLEVHEILGWPDEMVQNCFKLDG